jgi:hypothetical protein
MIPKIQNKIFMLFINVLLFGAVPSIAQSDFPVRTRWISPDDSQPMSYEQWKTAWNQFPKIMGGKVVYRSSDFTTFLSDSFHFGDDYAILKIMSGILMELFAPIYLRSAVLWSG